MEIKPTMIWYKDDELIIKFDKEPSVTMSYPMPCYVIPDEQSSVSESRNEDSRQEERMTGLNAKELQDIVKKRNREIDNKPFLNREDLEVTITTQMPIGLFSDRKTYKFIIPKGYTWDGATIPRLFWRFIGSNTSPEFLIPSMIHDVLCENHSYIDNDRYLSTLILERLLYCSGVSGFKRWMMKHSVDNYQKIKGGWK